MTINTTVKMCMAAAMFLATNAFAEPLNWQYIDARYQQPSDGDVQGLAAELSGYIGRNWVLQSRASRLRLKESALDLEISQTRYDLAVGRVFAVGNNFAALLSAGYTRLEYQTDLGSLDEHASDNAGNVQLALRTGITNRLEAEASAGVLFDDSQSSDLLWNAGLRYHATENVSLLIGASGVSNDSFDSDDILYEIGFRFDLKEK